MRCGNEYSPNVMATVHLGTDKLFKLLTIPQEDREEFISEPYEVNGQTKTVNDMTTRELQKISRQMKKKYL